jgi:hypothetical protein
MISNKDGGLKAVPSHRKPAPAMLLGSPRRTVYGEEPPVCVVSCGDVKGTIHKTNKRCITPVVTHIQILSRALGPLVVPQAEDIEINDGLKNCQLSLLSSYGGWKQGGSSVELAGGRDPAEGARSMDLIPTDRE